MSVASAILKEGPYRKIEEKTMALQMRPDLRMSQQLVMTPQLQQAIKLLQLSRLELTDLVRDELLENPLLEESAEAAESGSGEDSGDRSGPEAGPEPAPAEAKVEEVQVGEVNDDFDWKSVLENNTYLPPDPGSGGGGGDELPSLEATHSVPETLEEHLLWQVRMSNYSAADEAIAEFIIRCLGGDGSLGDITVTQIARRLGTSTLKVEAVLRRIHLLDPVAVASRNLAECLWIQANHPEHPIEDPLVLGIIAKHLHNLETRSYPAIARDTGEALEEVYEATKVIMALDPRPARAYSAESSQYVIPDVYIQKIGEEFVVSLNDDGLPRLRISNYYRSAIHSDTKAKEYISERLRSAQWLIRSIQQRQRTIVKVTKSILKFQRDFFERGVQHLRPLILKDVAEDISMHESTVSRVTTNKYVHTPQGIFELKYFFNTGISRRGGDELASEAVKTKIKILIDNEDPSQPYSDQKIVELLRDEGIDIARRTVAKYREQLNVLSSSKRRRLF